VTATVRDAEETITCRLNNTGSDGAETPFVYKDHTKTIYHGADSVGNGRFSFSFAVPRDISYTEGKGLMTLYAVDNAKAREAHGRNESFVLNGSGTAANDSIGPSIYCYLNTPSFPNGGRVNPTPYFVAELYDDSGINASGSSIGHDLELIIDGEMSRTYNLNSSFAYDFGDYRSGTARFSIPELAEGKHRLQFRAWDVLNNSSTATLDFEVVKGEAGSISVDCTRNPATNHTTFLITHDRAGTELTVGLDRLGEGFTPNIYGSGEGGQNPDIWGTQPVIGNVEGETYDHSEHAIYKGMNFVGGLYARSIYTFIGSGHKGDHNCMWDLNGLNLAAEPNVVKVFEETTNSTVLGTWNHVLDYCCAGIVDFAPTTTFKGRILAVGLAAYEWNIGGENSCQDQLEMFTKNCIDYLK
jgi:hypothetical protein